MKTENTSMFALPSAKVVIASSIIFATLAASAGFAATTLNDKGERGDQKTEVHAAIESGDYAAFAALTADKKISETITAENFARFQEFHAAKKNDDTETATAIAIELGLPSKEERKEMRAERKAEREANKEEVHAAIESADYAAFAALTADKKISEIITAENFARLQELHTAKENNDTETAKAIAEELGLDSMKKGRGGKKGERKGRGSRGASQKAE